MVENQVSAVLNPSNGNWLVAYHRVGLLQAALHRIADEAPEHPGGMMLDRERMRTMLALARLHFSMAELSLCSKAQLRALLAAYDAERENARSDVLRATSNGRLIRAWRLRHVRPLIDLYPYVVRHGLKRFLTNTPQGHEPKSEPVQVEVVSGIDRPHLVNELALAHCGVVLMRRIGRDRTRSNDTVVESGASRTVGGRHE